MLSLRRVENKAKTGPLAPSPEQRRQEIVQRMEELRDEIEAAKAILNQEPEAPLREQIRAQDLAQVAREELAELRRERAEIALTATRQGFDRIGQEYEALAPRLEAAALAVAEVWQEHEALFAELVRLQALVRNDAGPDDVPQIGSATELTSLPPGVLSPMKVLAAAAARIEELRYRENLVPQAPSMNDPTAAERRRQMNSGRHSVRYACNPVKVDRRGVPLPVEEVQRGPKWVPKWEDDPPRMY
jgi:hypothetical protein